MSNKEISPEKLLDMIRSILPSTDRNGARRSKAGKNRKVRRRVRMALHAEDAEETKADLCEVPHLSGMVRDRRGADKLNHFMRWCESWTRGMTDRQALDAVRAVLPRNLIGDHAFSHWEAYLKYRRRRRVGTYREQRERQEQSLYDKTRHRLRRTLSVDPGFQGRLNAAVKEGKELDEPRRMLLGIHDVDAFVHDVVTYRKYDKEERVLLGLLTEAERYGRRAWLQPAFNAASFCLIAPM